MTKEMNPYKYCISLRFSGVGFEPEDISTALSLTPNNSWKTGDPIINPPNTASRGNRRKSYWSHRFETDEHADLESSLSVVLALLLPHRLFLQGLASKGIDIELFIGLFGDENYGFTITPTHSKDLAELGIEIGFDVYPFADSNPPKR
jgi:hypothetical protein